MQSVILNNGIEMPILGFEVNQIENLNIFDFELSKEDMERISKLDTNMEVLRNGMFRKIG